MVTKNILFLVVIIINKLNAQKIKKLFYYKRLKSLARIKKYYKMKNKIISAKYMNKSDLNKLSKTELIQLILTKNAQKQEKNTISSNSMTLKQLSNYLPDAKKIGYTRNQLMKKSTRGVIMNNIQRYRNIESVHDIIPKAIRDSQKYLELDRKLKQKERLIRQQHKK